KSEGNAQSVATILRDFKDYKIPNPSIIISGQNYEVVQIKKNLDEYLNNPEMVEQSVTDQLPFTPPPKEVEAKPVQKEKPKKQQETKPTAKGEPQLPGKNQQQPQQPGKGKSQTPSGLPGFNNQQPGFNNQQPGKNPTSSPN